MMWGLDQDVDKMMEASEEKMKKMESMVSALWRQHRVSATKNLHGDLARHMTTLERDNFSTSCCPTRECVSLTPLHSTPTSTTSPTKLCFKPCRPRNYSRNTPYWLQSWRMYCPRFSRIQEQIRRTLGANINIQFFHLPTDQ